MNIIDIAYALTAPVEAVMFFMLFDTFFERRRQFPAWQYVVGVVVLAMLIKLSNAYLLFKAGNIIGMILAAIFVSGYYYRTSIKRRIFLPVFTWALWSAIETITFNSITLLFNITASEAMNIPGYLVLGIIISKSIQFIISYVVYVKKIFRNIELGKVYWIVFLILFFIATCVSYLIFWTLDQINDPNYNLLAMFCTLGLYISTFLAFYLFARTQHQNQVIRYQEQSEQQMRMQLKHMDETILNQNELRALRHDMNSHLIALKSFFDARDFKGGSRYIENLDTQFQQAALSVTTGNNALDSVLSAKRSLAESKGIAFHTKIKIQENLPIAPEDCSIIFGNALDNALEACERLPADAEKSINLFLQQDATTIFCKITNTAPPNTEKTFLTSKADKVNHGFGMKNIKEALEKYPSLYNFKQQENQFEFSFSVFY
jgi:two-component system sensor histidine kinase AgrC